MIGCEEKVDRLSLNDEKSELFFHLYGVIRDHHIQHFNHAVRYQIISKQHSSHGSDNSASAVYIDLFDPRFAGYQNFPRVYSWYRSNLTLAAESYSKTMDLLIKASELSEDGKVEAFKELVRFKNVVRKVIFDKTDELSGVVFDSDCNHWKEAALMDQYTDESSAWPSDDSDVRAPTALGNDYY